MAVAGLCQSCNGTHFHVYAVTSSLLSEHGITMIPMTQASMVFYLLSFASTALTCIYASYMQACLQLQAIQ